MNETVIIDPEFKSLCPPLSADEYEQLEKNCTAEGIRDALVVWKTPNGNNTLVDGHNRYEIAKRHNLNYSVTGMDFINRDEAKIWIIENQLGRRNLPLFDRVTLEDQKKDILARQAKEKQYSGKADPDKKSCQGATQKEKNKIDRQNKTDYIIAKSAGTSEDTVRKVRAINESDDERLKEQVRSGDVSINQGYRIVKGISDKTPAQAKKEFIQQIKDERDEFKEKKTVEISDIKKDKENRTILANDIYARLLRMGQAISEMKFDIANGNVNLVELSKEFSEEQKNNVVITLGRWSMMLNEIMGDITE